MSTIFQGERFPTATDIGPSIWRARLYDFRSGRFFGFPLCCVLRYSLARYANQAVRRGACETPSGGRFIPCGILHRHDPGYPPMEGRAELTYRQCHGGYSWLLPQKYPE